MKRKREKREKEKKVMRGKELERRRYFLLITFFIKT